VTGTSSSPSSVMDEELKVFFNSIDTNQDGFISSAELLGYFKVDIEKQVNEIMGGADIDRDGKMNYQEYVKSVTASPSSPSSPSSPPSSSPSSTHDERMLHMAYTLKNHFAHKPLTLIDAQEKEEEYKAFFSFIDKDGDGFISAAELLGFFKTTLDETFPVGAIEQMMGEADIDGDGKINYEEFVKQMTALAASPSSPPSSSSP